MDNFEEKLKELPLRAPSSELDQQVLMQKPPRILPVAGRQSAARRGRLFWMSAAAVVIFFCGFLMGAKTQGPGAAKTMLVKTPAPKVSETPPVRAIVDNDQALQTDEGQADEPTTVNPAGQEDVDVAAVQARRYRDEQGRLVIETTPESGGGMIWVIDGSFQLAGSTIDEQQEQPE